MPRLLTENGCVKNYDVISGIAQYFTHFFLHKDDVIHLPGHARSYLRRIHFAIASSCLRTDMTTIFLDNDCFFNMQSAYSTEEMVLLCMLKYLNIFEFEEWLRTRDLRAERNHMWVICKNKCQKCILRNVGLPLFPDLRK